MIFIFSSLSCLTDHPKPPLTNQLKLVDFFFRVEVNHKNWIRKMEYIEVWVHLLFSMNFNENILCYKLSSSVLVIVWLPCIASISFFLEFYALQKLELRSCKYFLELGSQFLLDNLLYILNIYFDVIRFWWDFILCHCKLSTQKLRHIYLRWKILKIATIYDANEIVHN